MFEDSRYVSILRDFKEEHEKLRSDPKSYIPYLKQWKERVGDTSHWNGPHTRYLAPEEAKSIVEAIHFLNDARPVKGGIEVSKALWRVAQHHADDTGKNGTIGHTGTDGLNLQQRLSRYVEHVQAVGESWNYHGFNHARDCILDLLILGGLGEERQRQNLLDPKFISIGVGLAEHTLYGEWVVINYGSDVVAKDENDNYLLFESQNETSVDLNNSEANNDKNAIVNDSFTYPPLNVIYISNESSLDSYILPKKPKKRSFFSKIFGCTKGATINVYSPQRQNKNDTSISNARELL